MLAARSSNHKPLRANFSEELETRISYKKGFKFEASWLLDDEYNRIIQDAWVVGEGGATSMYTTQLKLSNCQVDLTRWSQKKYVNAENY